MILPACAVKEFPFFIIILLFFFFLVPQWFCIEYFPVIDSVTIDLFDAQPIPSFACKNTSQAATISFYL